MLLFLTMALARFTSTLRSRDDKGSITVEQAVIIVVAATMAAATIGAIAAAFSGKLNGFSL